MGFLFRIVKGTTMRAAAKEEQEPDAKGESRTDSGLIVIQNNEEQ